MGRSDNAMRRYRTRSLTQLIQLMADPSSARLGQARSIGRRRQAREQGAVAVIAAKEVLGARTGAALTNRRPGKAYPGCCFPTRSVDPSRLRAATYMIGLDVDAKIAARHRAHRRLLATD